MLTLSTVLTLVLLCAALFMSVAVTSDLITRRIPNALNVPVFAAALIAHTVAGAVVRGDGGLLGALRWFGFSLGGFAVGFGILYVLWLVGGSGGGDVKMMGALGAWLGPALTIYILFVGAALALVFTFCVLAQSLIGGGFRKTKNRYLKKTDAKHIKKRGETLQEAQTRAGARRRIIPFGLPIAVATWSCFVLFLIHPDFILKLWS